MNIHDRRGLKDMAAASLQEALPDYRKLVLLHAVIAAGASLVLTLLNMLLEHGIGGTGGLSGMGLRSVLTALQSFLTLAVTVALPFWDLGVVWTAIRTARRQKTKFSMLTQGFRRYGPVLRLLLLRMVLYFTVGIVCSNIGSIAAMFVPMSEELTQTILSMEEQILADPLTAIEQIPVELMLEMLLPSLIVTLVLYLGACVYLEYRFRFANYLVVDEVRVGAFAAMRLSNAMTKDSKWALFRLDLSLWWYYALQLVLLAVNFGDLILPALGVTLPVSGEVAPWLFLGLYYAGFMALTWFAAPYIQTVYATAYNLLRVKILPSQPPEEQ